MKIPKMTYAETESKMMKRFRELRKDTNFLEEVIEVLDIEFDGYKHQQEVIQYIIETQQ